jgi:hypothetical protein
MVRPQPIEAVIVWMRSLYEDVDGCMSSNKEPLLSISSGSLILALRARARKFDRRAVSLAFSALLLLYLADERRSRSTGVPTGSVAKSVRRMNPVKLGWRM